jgi:hypothetical protein
MSIIGLLLIIAIIGLIAWALVKFVPMPQPIQTLLVIAACIIIILIMLNAFGLLNMNLGTVPRVGSR